MGQGLKKKMKRKERKNERKKKKIAAYLAIAKLNDDDREMKQKANSSSAEGHGREEGPSHKKFKKDEPIQVVDGSVCNSPNKSDKLSFHNLPSIVHSCNVTEDNSVMSDNPSCSGETLDDLKRAVRERKRKLQVPQFRLKECGEMASLHIPEEQRLPFFMVDVQHILIWSLIGHHAPFPPSRMYQLLKYNKLSHTVLLMVDGVCLDDLKSACGLLHLPPSPVDGVAPSSPDSANEKLFPWRLELMGPSVYGSSLVQDMATVPLSNTQCDKVIKMYGSLEKALKGKAVYKVFRAMFPVEKRENDRQGGKDSMMKGNSSEEKKDEASLSCKDKFPRTHLLLSADQMVQLGYPLPLVKSSCPERDKQPVIIPNEIHQEKQVGSVGRLIQSPEFLKIISNGQNDETPCNGDGLLNQEDDDDDDDDSEEELYVLSRPWYREVGPTSPMLSLDCEMCLTGRHRSELTRIAIVNEDLQVVYETLVKPHRKITNYLTKYSGITESMLKDVKTRLKDVQQDIRKLLPPDAILIGQSLNFDLHALKMMHPYVIDTSITFNLSGERTRRSKLATLAQLFLSETIQCHGSKGHDPTEDASAAMKLILLKLSKNIYYGDAAMKEPTTTEMCKKEKLLEDESLECPREHKGEGYGTSIFSHVKRGKHAAVVLGVNDVIKEYQKYAGEISKKTVYGEDCLQDDKPPNLISVEKSSEAISRACEVMLEHQLCIVHLSRQSVGDKLRKLEKWCSKIVKHCAPHSLCIIVLGGAEKANGACLIHLKGHE